MDAGYTKQVCMMFTLDHEGNVIDDSKFTGISFFTPEGNRSRKYGKPFAKKVPYDKMTQDQKTKFDQLVQDWESIKDQTE